MSTYITYIQLSTATTVLSGLLVLNEIRKLKNALSTATSPKILFKNVKPQYIKCNDVYVKALMQERELGNITEETYRLCHFFLWLRFRIRTSYWFEKFTSFKRSIAWKLLEIARNDPIYSSKAIETLAHIKGLTDVDAWQLGQACDAKTAIALARTPDVDLRLIFELKRNLIEKRLLLRRVQSFFQALDASSKHPCLHNFYTERFSDDPKLFDEEFRLTIADPKILLECVEVLTHHSWIEGSASDIIEHGGLSLLMDIYNRVVEDKDEDLELFFITISRLLSSISICGDYSKQFHHSGWVKVLASWIRHEDPRIAVPAARALINCDTDNGRNLQSNEIIHCCRNIYLLHPVFRTSRTPSIDIVFVHGLLGGVFVTWRQRTSELVGQSDLKLPTPNSSAMVIDDKDVNLTEYELVLSDIPIDANAEADSNGPFTLPKNAITESGSRWTRCWPKDWLPKDINFPFRVLGVNYDTLLTMWSPKCPISSSKKTFRDRSDHLTNALIEAGLGKRPIVWITHSMGGLIIKDLLVNCVKSQVPSHRALVDMTKGIVFFSTPHKGSKLATLNKTTQLIFWPSTEVQELRQDSKSLLTLHKNFLDLVNNRRIRVLSLAEREPTLIRAVNRKILFVDENSSNAETGEHFAIPLDHLCICKPASRYSFLYLKVVDFINNCLKANK